MMKIAVSSLLISAALLSPDTMPVDQGNSVSLEKPYVRLEAVNTTDINNRDAADNRISDAGAVGSSGPCAPYCVKQQEFVGGIQSVAELEVFEFMESSYLSGDGVIVDLRNPDRYAKGTIPGSINVPPTAFEQPADKASLQPLFERLGVRARGEVGAVVRVLEKLGMFGGKYKTDLWDFTAARDVLLWCNDAQCDETHRAFDTLVSLGYPPEKLFCYRGGMHMWQSLGLATIVPDEQSAYASK